MVGRAGKATLSRGWQSTCGGACDGGGNGVALVQAVAGSGARVLGRGGNVRVPGSPDGGGGNGVALFQGVACGGAIVVG